MKKKLVLGIVTPLLAIGIFLGARPNHPKHFSPPPTTQNPVDPPSDLLNPPAPVVPPQTPPVPPTIPPSSPILDMKSNDYPAGLVVSQSFTPTQVWTWNVDYTCSGQTSTTQLPSGNYQTNDPNTLPVYLMVYVPKSGNLTQEAIIYHHVQTNDSSGSYSVVEPSDATFYFKINSLCSWHIRIYDNAAPLFSVVQPSN